MKTNDTYQEPITMNFPGMVARVYHPILTPEEKAKRMQAIHKASANLLKGVQAK